jgi:recombination protein RecR
MSIRHSSAAIENLVAEFSRLPGIGRRTAQRMVMSIVKYPKGEILKMAESLQEVAHQVRLCSVCSNLTENDPCELCSNPERDGKIVCVVEDTPDVLAIEKTGSFKGRYHVLHGALSPLDGIGPEDLKIKELLVRLKEEVAEVILATNPSVEGEATAVYLARMIKPMGIRTTRIAQGLPMGAAIEFADQGTLTRALSGRSEV